MRRDDLNRAAEAAYGQLVERIVTRLKREAGDVWAHFAAGVQGHPPGGFEEAARVAQDACLEAVRGCSESELGVLWRGSDALWKPAGEDPGNRAAWEEGVHRELYERVRYAAGEAVPNSGRIEEQGGHRLEAHFRFDADDLAFLSQVARRLASVAAQPGLAAEKAAAIRRAVAALKKLPEPTPAIAVRIEVTHRMGGHDFSESYRYTVVMDSEHIEIVSSGSQYDPAVGVSSFALESLEWRADGQSAQRGNRDIWLERLAYALTREYTVEVTSRDLRLSGDSRFSPDGAKV
jgi:hypothetical protein